MSKPASDATLSLLHRLMAEEFVALIKGEYKETVLTRDGNPIEITRKASAAEFAVIRAFLKDNNITGIPEDNTALGRLKEALAAKQAGRSASLPVNPALDVPEPEYPVQ